MSFSYTRVTWRRFSLMALSDPTIHQRNPRPVCVWIIVHRNMFWRSQRRKRRRNQHTKKKIDQRRINSTNLMVRTGSENKEQIIFPYAILSLGEKCQAINLLESSAELNQDENLANSISFAEYKLAHGLQNLQTKEFKNVLITTGHGELIKIRHNHYSANRTGFIMLAMSISTVCPSSKRKLIWLLWPNLLALSEKNKFTLDQYIMNGGKVIF